MKYIRQFTRKQERNHTKTLEQQKYDLDLARKVLTAVTAFSFIGNPFAAMASTVTRVDGTKVDFQNNVGNIYAEKIVNNNTAVNRFQDFKIDAGDIANMYFKTDANSKDLANNLANNLVNFVNSRIDVAGTVNAIKDSKIGGNLFFLSSSGMAVTGSGVINAGSLYVMTPTESYMKGILGDDLKGFDAEAFDAQWKNISTMQVPVNASGTITVEGKIHTTNGIGMKAAQIRVGKEGTASDSNAWLKTGIVDFSGLVNIKNDDGTVTDAGLGKTLTATKTGSGDIVLAAVATERNEKDTDFDNSTTDNNLVHASITMNGTIDAAGDADITATASSGEAYEKYFNDEGGETADELDVWGQIVKTKADIAINGDVTAQHVNVAAESRNSFITSGVADTPLSTINAVAGAFTLNMDAAYAVLGGEASVDIGKEAVLTAKAPETAATADTPEKKSINITADSRVNAAAGSSTTAVKAMNFKHSGNIPSVAAAYANTENKANVRIAGTIKAAGDTNISANADTHLEAVSTDNTTYLGGNVNDKTRVNSAITIANGKNTSTVEIADTAKMTEISGDLDISAVGTNSIDTEALVKGKEEAAAATAVNVTNYESSADVKVNASLKADSVSVTAGNLVTNNTVTADNSIGTGMLMTGATSTVLGSQTMGTIKEKVQEIKKKFYNPEDTVGTFVDKLGDMISVGASVAVADESNAAHVSIGKDVQITAQDAEGKKGDITVRANNIVEDTQMKALGTTNNHTDENNPNLLVSAAVLDASISNEAGVTIEGGEAADGKHAILSGANVTVEANSEFRYGRIDRMIGDLLLMCEKLKGAYASNAEYTAKIEELAKKAQTYKDNVAKDPNWADSQEGNDAMLALAAAAQNVSDDSVTAQIKDIFVGPLTVAGAAAAFANPANYANFQASSNNSGKGDASLGLAGSVNINRLENNASVRIGREAEINASGKADVNAVVAQKDVAISGKIGLNGGAETAVGGTAGIHFGQTNSLVTVAEGAEITGAAVNVKADNDVMHTGIAIGAGKGGSNGLSGMANYMEGESTSIVSIDDEAVLTANGTGKSEGTDDGGVRIDAGNTTVIMNIAGGGALGQTSGIGASVAITDYTVDNIAAIADNDADASAGEDETKKRLLELVRKGLKKEEQAALFGSAANNAAGGGITARLLDVSSLNDSVINTVTIAGAAVTGDDSDEPGIADKIGTFFNNNANKVVNKFNQLDTAINNKLTHALDDPNILPTDMKPTKGNMGAKLPSLSIAGAGSASVNLVEGKTASLVDGAQVNLSGDSTALQVGAEDDSFIGAWGGAAAITWKQSVTDQNWNNKNVGLAGAVAVNLTDTAAISRISGTTIEGADAIVNTAKKGGALVAAGLGLSAAKAGQGGGQSYNGAASVSVNDSKNTIEAVMENNTVNQENGSSVKTELTNSAYDNDTQVTGGINASLVVGGDKGVAIGGTVGYSSLTNTVTSAIRGGTYNDMGTVDVSALTDITQVGVAAGVSATTTSGGQSIGFNGVAAYNSLTNTVTAGIEDADVMAETVGVRAQDMDLGEKKYDTYISDRGLDATGQSYINNVKDTADDLEDPGKTGNTIVTGALGISAATDSKGGAGAAAISISDINNDFDAHITGGKVTASGTESGADVADVDVYAKSDTLLVGVAAGGAGTNGNITGVGSLTWQTIDNDTTASIEKANIYADTTSVRALTGSLGVNVAGQISAGKNAVGLALAYNNIENTTGAYVKGGSIDRYENEDGTAEGSASVTVEGKNNSKLYAVGAGVGVSTDKLAANGTIAINIGRNNTEAVIDAASDGTRAKLDHISSLSVTTDDQSSELAVAGGVGVSKTVAVGGAVAYNEIGNISGKGDEKKQQNTAQVNHADITTEDGAAIEVGAKDNSSLTTAAVGVGITAGGLAAVQGSAATALINKNTEASMDGTVISSASKAETGEAASAADAGADVDVNAESHNSILTTADVLAANAGGTGAAVGAGVAVNRSEADVKAAVTGGTMHVKDLRVDALNQANIETIGVGGSVQAGTGAGVTGSVAVNQIGNTTTAVIAGGADIAASNNVIVAASSDESIANYAGSISVAVQGAAVGLSVSVNEITSGTHASVEGDDTKVSAEGKGDKEKVKDSVGDDKILDGFVDKDAFDGTASLADERKDSEYSGVAVSASSTHTIKSFLVNGGAAGEGAAVNGTVNVNMIGGSTSAAIRGADINTNAASAGDVHVTAHDYANSAGIVGTVNGTGIGAAVGLGSDTNTVSREVSAEILGKGAADDNGRYASKNTVNADTLSVDAEAKQGISSLTTGISVGGIGAGVSNATSVALLEGKTAARINGTAVSAASLDVTADHAAKMNTLGVAVGAGGAGAGVGIGVSVLNENSETSAEATDAEIAMTGADGEVTIKANNHTKVNYQLYNGGGAVVGAAGSIGVSNVNSKVNTIVEDTSIGKKVTYTEEVQGDDGKTTSVEKEKIEGAAKNITIGAKNEIDFTNKSGTAGVGAAGVGVGVAVNTIDSQVQTHVENAKLYASGDIGISANETRTVNQLAVNAQAGGAAGGANVMVTNVGKAVDSVYGSNLQTDDDGNAKEDGVDMDSIYAQANDAINGNRLQSSYTLGAVSEEDPASTTYVTAGKGGEQESMVKVTVDGSTLDAGGRADLDAIETTNVKMDGIQATASMTGSVSGTVGILGVHRNSGVEVTSSAIRAAEFDVQATVNGKADLNIYQGTLGGAASIGAAYGSISTDGKSGVGIGNSSIETTGGVTVSAEDTSQADVEAIGVALAGGGAASVIVAEGTNSGETTVTVNHTDITAGNTISVNAKREAEGDSLHVRAIAGSGGLIFAGAGVSAIANEMGTVGTEVIGGSHFTAGDTIGLYAKNAPSVTAETGAVSGSMFASAAITVAEANVGGSDEEDHLKTIVNVDDSNTFTADAVTAKAEAGIKQTVDMNGLSISASPFSGITGAAQVNTGGAEVYSDVDVHIGASVFQGRDSGAADLNVSGLNTVTQIAAAKGISASTGIATGTNLASTAAHLSTQVTAKGNEQSRLGNVDIKGSSYAKIDNDANGYGGALIDISPYAAKVENNYTADTDVTLSGTWNTTGSFTAQALNGMDVDLKSDAVRAAIVGGSGTWLNNIINNSANVTLDNANITTEGAQSYVAQNQVDYVGEIDGSGYGGINVNATDYADDLDFTAGVDITNSKLTGAGDEGSITAFASTEGTIHSKNSLKSAGVIPVALAFSDHDITYNNSVNVTNATLTTDKKDQDITLAATDDTDVKLETIADTQGGAVGAASAKAKNVLDRSNKITVGSGSTLHSTNDVNLYAGANTNAVKSDLNLQVLADAYNKTVIPLATAPKVDNSMRQANQVTVGGTVESVRHINASAAKGTTTVTESAQEYKIWTGTGGNGSVASTAFGDTIASENTDNYVNVTGSATAGIHNKLDITIKGQTSAAYDESTQMGSVGYDGIQVEIGDGKEWFDADSLTPSAQRLYNGLMERYNEVQTYLDAYSGDTDSEAYKAYAAEKTLLLNEMLKAGMAEQVTNKDDSTNIIPLDYVDLPSIEIPDIVVSGGNINIETDVLQGGGTLTAQGAPKLSITNNSDLYLKINDLTISDNGGTIDMSGVGKDSFTGNKTSASPTEEVPTISIHGTGDPGNFGDKHVQADIGVFGDITNTAGNIDITNDNYNILINGNVNGRNIAIKATHGDVTQTNSTGIINVGNDPIANIQFSESVAHQIQEYLHSQKGSGSISFASYGEYINWLVNTVGVSLKDLGISGKLEVSDIVSTDNNLNERVHMYYLLKLNKLLTQNDIQAVIDEAKAGGAESWVTFLDKVGATYAVDKDALIAIAAPQGNDGDKDRVILAGGNVYISGMNVNIGGLVQSGYGDYSTKLDKAAEQKIADLDTDWKGNQTVLTDADVLGNDKYLVNDGGEKWNSETGVWDYEVKVYYNPSTGELITESVAPKGGQIQISGKISSTGGGRIIAADGAADINIDTKAVDKDVKVNSITGNDISGLITITDKNQVDANGNYLITEYQNGQTRSYYSGQSAGEWTTAGADDMKYTPKEGAQFAWTGGVSSSLIEKYTYSKDFLFWGALPYNKTEDILEDAAQSKVTLTPTPVTSGENDAALADGSLITGGYSGGDKVLTINWQYSKSDNRDEIVKSDPSVKKEYDGVAGKIFGYGEFHYTWTETTPDQTTSSTGIKADNPISIGFIGNGDGDISVTSGGDMTLAGNISNASVVDGNNQIVGKGSVTLTSTGGSITNLGNATINSDNVTLSATGKVVTNDEGDVIGNKPGDISVNHAAIGSDATVNISSADGDISFISTKGNITVEQAVTGGSAPISAETGNVYLEAAGNILDGHTSGDYAVKGQRIDLISKMGSIGTKNKALTILGGSELYSSDTMASSVNASAAGDIVLTQTSGNMRLGTIESTNGDAVLTVADGSFVDAHPSENSSSSSAQDKIDRWLESGLIDKNDKANESTNAADKAKAERVEALTNRANSLAGGDKAKVESYWTAADAFYKDEGMQQAKETYLNAVAKAGGDKEKINAAYETYQQAQKDYFADKGFSTDEQNLISSYAEVSNSDNYGWSKNELLYAIQDSVLNTKPGEVQTVDTPNVSAKNITLKAASGGIGIDGEAQFISNDALNDVENLKILAAAKAGDLTWSDDGVTVRQQQAITVQVKDKGQVNVTGRDNVYLAGVEGTMLDINDIETTGDIRLQGDAGVDVDFLKGQDLTIVGGAGNITSSSNEGGYIHTDLTGSIDANADGTISFESVNGSDLKILTAATNKDLNLKADGNILMQNAEGSTAQGRLNANVINLEAGAGGTIGTADTAIRILDNGAVVNATADGGIWLSGETGKESTGSLVIGNIEGGSFDLTSVSDVSLGRADDPNTDEDKALTGSITTTKGKASISAVNVDLADGSVYTGKYDFNVTANGGNITQSAASEGGLTANHVNLSSTGSQLLRSENNKINSVTVKGLTDDSLTGNVEIHSAADSFGVQFGDKNGDTATGITVNDGSIYIHHDGSANGALDVTGSAMTQKSAGSEESADISFRSEESADISFRSEQSAIHIDGAMTAGDNFYASTDSGAITVTGDVKADDDVTATTQSGSITVNGAVWSGTDTTFHAGGTEEAAGDITVNGAVHADRAVTAETTVGNIFFGGTTEAGTGITFTSNAGDISTTGSLTTAIGDVSAKTGSGAITLGGAVSATIGNVIAHSDAGAIEIKNNVMAGTDIDLNSGETGGISVTGKATAENGKIEATTNEGDILITNAAEAGQSIHLSSGSGAITVKGSATAGSQFEANAGSGTITLGGDVTANGGSVTAHTGSGNVSVSGKADASQDIDLSSDGGSISVTGDAEAGQDFSATTGGGNITLGGSITAETGKVLAQTGSGMIQVGGNVSSALDTELTAGAETGDEGTVIVNGAIDSGKEVHASTANGDILFKGATTAHGGDVTATVSGDGDITFNGAVTAVSNGESGGNIIANVAGNGDITTEKDALFNADEDVQFTTNDGDITTGSTVEAGRDIIFNAVGEGGMTIHKDLTAGQNVELNVNKGDIFFDGGKAGASGEDVKVTAETGDVTFTVNTEGDIKDTHREPNGDKAIISADNGSITVDHQGVGDVDLYELFAKEDAKISVADGDLYLGKVSGDLVAVLVKTEGKVMDVQHVEAATEIQISGSDMDLDDITQREDGDGFLVISPEGTSTDRPIDNFTIGNIKTNGGVRFEHLWLNNGNIHVSDGALHLDKIYVEDKATVSTDAMTTDIFGSAPVFDDSVSSAYWVNTGRNKPKDNQDVWQSEGVSDMYMYLYFDADGAVQYSNGNLLHLADHNYVYNQRYSQVDWMNIFTDKDFYNFYDRYYAPELSFHERYGLTSGDGYRVENAEEDDLVVK